MFCIYVYPVAFCIGSADFTKCFWGHSGRVELQLDSSDNNNEYLQSN